MQHMLMKQQRMMSFHSLFFIILRLSKFSAKQLWLCLYGAAQHHFHVIWGKFTGETTHSASGCECNPLQAREGAAQLLFPTGAASKALSRSGFAAMHVSPYHWPPAQPAACSPNSTGLHWGALRLCKPGHSTSPTSCQNISANPPSPVKNIWAWGCTLKICQHWGWYLQERPPIQALLKQGHLEPPAQAQQALQTTSVCEGSCSSFF